MTSVSSGQCVVTVVVVYWPYVTITAIFKNQEMSQNTVKLLTTFIFFNTSIYMFLYLLNLVEFSHQVSFALFPTLAMLGPYDWESYDSNSMDMDIHSQECIFILDKYSIG